MANVGLAFALNGFFEDSQKKAGGEGKKVRKCGGAGGAGGGGGGGGGEADIELAVDGTEYATDNGTEISSDDGARHGSKGGQGEPKAPEAAEEETQGSSGWRSEQEAAAAAARKPPPRSNFRRSSFWRDRSAGSLAAQASTVADGERWCADGGSKRKDGEGEGGEGGGGEGDVRL